MCGVLWLPVTANVLRAVILVTLKMEAINSSEMSVLTRATRRNNPEDTILELFIFTMPNMMILIYD
jgi:hypothetical protein